MEFLESIFSHSIDPTRKIEPETMIGILQLPVD